MTTFPLIDPLPPSRDRGRRRLALRAAMVLRDCSFLKHSSTPEKRACPTLMRQAAITWRHGTTAGNWE
jgi:hypothetical protein